MRLLGLSPELIAAPEMRAVWSDRATVQAVLDVEAALAAAQARLGLIPAAAASAIGAAADAGRYDLDALAAGALRSGTLAIPLVRALTEAAGPAAAGHVHFGATSQDVLDTGMALQARKAVALLQQTGAAAVGALARLAREHAETPMLGRTLLQPGPPITFGLKAAGWLGAVERSLARVGDAAESALVLQFGGAVGTLASLGERGVAVSEALGEALGLPVPDAPWHAQRDRLAALGCAVAVLVGALAKVARDVSLLMQAELGEASEPPGAGRGGSSTMPHKANPVASVVILAAAARAPGLAAGLLAGLAQEHERAAGGWQAEAAALAELFLCASGALREAATMLAGLVVHADRMAGNIARMRGLTLSERLMLRLAPTLGRGEAHALAERLVAQCARGSGTLHEAAAADPQVAAVLDPDALALLFDPATYLGSTAAFIARTLGDRQPTVLPPLPPPGEGRGEGAPTDRYAAGLAVRRAVLGDAWVDAALAKRTEFSGPFQDLITRYAWGEIWTRPGLDHRTRRLLVLAITASLGRWEEFRLHARAGLEQAGFSRDDLREVLMHTAIYAGVPAANTGFHVAEEILRVT